MLIAGDDDQLWSSLKASRAIMDRLNETGHTAKFGNQILCYPGLGHWFPLPGTPTTHFDRFVYDETRKAAVLMGGTAAATAKAVRDADQKIRTFLERSLKLKT